MQDPFVKSATRGLIISHIALGLAGFGVAFRAKPRVAAAARMSVAHGDLTALLFLQGYRRSEFAEPAPANAVFTRP
jgi:hypothetical protein